MNIRHFSLDRIVLRSQLLASIVFFSIALSSHTLASDMRRGLIVLSAVEGDVKVINPLDSKKRTPSRGDIIKQGETIITGSGASASLAFENGTVMEIAGSSKVVLQEFLQAPWGVSKEDINASPIEHSRSKTTTFLDYGTLTSGVKKLKNGSTLQVATPLGTAGIRGTDFQVNAQRNIDGSPKRLFVGVSSGEVGVQSTAGGEPVAVAASQAASIVVSQSPAGGQAAIQQPTLSQLSADVGNAISQSVQSQRSGGNPALIQALSSPGQGADSSNMLTSEQKKALEEAGKQGEQAVVDAVKQLVTEKPNTAVDIAVAATEIAPTAAPEIAAAAATAAPSLAPQIAMAVSMILPSSAPSVAASVSQAVPSEAPRIAASVATVAPSLAPQIAASVVLAVPQSAAAILGSVASVQPQQTSQILDNIMKAAPEADLGTYGDSLKSGSAQSVVPESSVGGIDSTIQPVINPTPGPTATPTPGPTATPTPSPTIEPTPTPTPVPSKP